MHRVGFALAILLALGVAPAAAQTRVHVSLGFGAPQPWVSGYVVVGRPHHRWRHYHRRAAFIEGRPEMIVVSRRVHHRRHRWHQHW